MATKFETTRPDFRNHEQALQHFKECQLSVCKEPLTEGVVENHPFAKGRYALKCPKCGFPHWYDI